MSDLPQDQHRQEALPTRRYGSIYPPWDITPKLGKALVQGAIAGGVLLLLSIIYYRLLTQRGHWCGMSCWADDVGRAVPWLAGLWAMFSFCRQLATTINERAENSARVRRSAILSNAAAKEQARQEAIDRPFREELRRVHAARMAAEREQTLMVPRRKRLAELEREFLAGFTTFSIAGDFAGPAFTPAMADAYLSKVLRTAPPDIGLLLESSNPAVWKIIGDGSRLPKPPALPKAD